MLQQHRVTTHEELVDRLPTARDIPSLTKDKAKQALLKSRKLLDATMEAVKQLHHWSLSVNFEATAAIEQSRLNNETHNKQINELTEMFIKVCHLNWEPFRAIFDRAAEDPKALDWLAWHITDKMQNMSHQRLVSKLTTRVKNSIKKLDKLADNYSKLSDRIFDSSLMYHAASLVLANRGGPCPQWYVPSNQRNNLLNFSCSSLRNTGVVLLVTGDPVNPPNLEPAPQQLQILPPPPVVEHPDNNNDNIGMDNWRSCARPLLSAVFFFGCHGT